MWRNWILYKVGKVHGRKKWRIVPTMLYRTREKSCCQLRWRLFFLLNIVLDTEKEAETPLKHQDISIVLKIWLWKMDRRSLPITLEIVLPFQDCVRYWKRSRNAFKASRSFCSLKDMIVKDGLKVIAYLVDKMWKSMVWFLKGNSYDLLNMTKNLNEHCC